MAAAAVALLALGACAAGPNETAGTLLGGAAGGIAGAQIGSGSGQLVATGVGAGLGAAAGGALGRGLDRPAREWAPTPYVDRGRRPGIMAGDRGHRWTAGHPRRYAAGTAASVRPLAGWAAGYDTLVVDAHRQVPIPGAEQTDDIGVFDFLVPPATPHYPPALQQTAAPAADPNCRRSDRPTLKPVYLCDQGAASYVVQ